MQPGNWPDGHRPLVDARGNLVGIVAAKLDASAVPDVAAKRKEPKSLQPATPAFEGVVKSTHDAAILVLAFWIRKPRNRNVGSEDGSWFHGFLINLPAAVLGPVY